MHTTITITITITRPPPRQLSHRFELGGLAPQQLEQLAKEHYYYYYYDIYLSLSLSIYIYM